MFSSWCAICSANPPSLCAQTSTARMAQQPNQPQRTTHPVRCRVWGGLPLWRRLSCGWRRYLGVLALARTPVFLFIVFRDHPRPVRLPSVQLILTHFIDNWCVVCPPDRSVVLPDVYSTCPCSWACLWPLLSPRGVLRCATQNPFRVCPPG
jgi:hypothetical protein